MSSAIERYMLLRYPIELVPDPDGGFVAEHPDLPGCVAQGTTPDEAVQALNEARKDWIESRIEDGLPVPEPLPEDEREYSGKFVLRVPRSMHAMLVRRAARDGVSLNQYVGIVLAKHLGATPYEALAAAMHKRLEDTLEDLKIAVQSTTTSVTPAAFRARSPSLGACWLGTSSPWMVEKAVLNVMPGWAVRESSPELEDSGEWFVDKFQYIQD